MIINTHQEVTAVLRSSLWRRHLLKKPRIKWYFPILHLVIHQKFFFRIWGIRSSYVDPSTKYSRFRRLRTLWAPLEAKKKPPCPNENRPPILRKRPRPPLQIPNYNWKFVAWALDRVTANLRSSSWLATVRGQLRAVHVSSNVDISFHLTRILASYSGALEFFFLPWYFTKQIFHQAVGQPRAPHTRAGTARIVKTSETRNIVSMIQIHIQRKV